MQAGNAPVGRDLEGLLVVALEQAVAAPLATSRLADAGARVIKIERPEGDFARAYDRLVHGESAYFVWLNRGKESICLDLRQGPDMALMRRMLDGADVFIQNLAPGAAERLGLGWEALRAVNPRLIHVSITGYGTEGAYRDQKAYDLLIQGESGLLSVTGTPEAAARVGISVCDIAAGETAFAAILQSLLVRGRTGQGRAVEVSLFQTMADWMNVPHLQAAYGAKPPRRMGIAHPSIAPYGAFACADGGQVLLAVQSDREWQMLVARVLLRPELGDDGRFATNVARIAHRAEVDRLVAEVIGQMTREAAIGQLTAAGIACGRVSDLADLDSHPQAARIRVDTPSGPVEMMGRGVRLPPGGIGHGRVPALDEHGAALRREFGVG